MRSLSRQERARRIKGLLEEERGATGPAEDIREGISARVETTLGPDVSNAQVLERQIEHSARASLSLVPKVAKPALASLFVYAPIALASLGAVTSVGAIAFVTLAPETQDHFLQTMHLPGGSRLRASEVAPSAAPVPAVATPEAPAVTPAEPPSIVEVPAEPASRHRASRAVVPPATPPVPSRDLSLAEESALLEQARADLLRGAAVGALQTLATHERRFPSGRMIEQREALAIQALVRAGRRQEASQRAQQFRERFPGSLMLEVIQSALDNEGP